MPETDEQSPLLPVLEQLHINFHAFRQAIESGLAPLKARARDPAFLAQASAEELEGTALAIGDLQTEIRQYKETHLRLVSLLKLRLTTVVEDRPTLNAQLLVLTAAYLGERGYDRALTRLLKLNPELRDFIDLDLIIEEVRLVTAVRNGDLDEAIQWCHDHRSSLKKCDPSLQFELQKQKFNQVGARDVGLALEYGRTAFKKVSPVHYPEISCEVRLLYRNEDLATETSNGKADPYTSALDGVKDGIIRERQASPANPGTQCSQTMEKLSWRLRRTMRQVYQRPARNMLINHALLGLAAIKTRRCASSVNNEAPFTRLEHQDDPVFQIKELNETSCPACNPDYIELARSVPVAHHTYSKLDSDLFVFPKSNILMGQSVIDRFIKKEKDGKSEEDCVLTDPHNLEPVKWKDLLKAYAL